MVNGDAVKQNRRSKRLGTGGARNATQKFKKGELFFEMIIFFT